MYRLTKTQLKILNILWEQEQATAKEITDLLNQRQPIAHSTVQTLLRRMERKGVVSHNADQRSFVFFPIVSREKVKKNAMGDMIDSLFHGSAKSMISYLVRNKYVSISDFEEMQTMIGNDPETSESLPGLEQKKHSRG